MRRRNGTGRKMAMLLGGVAGGIIGGRLLPPLFAAMTAAGRTRAGADPFALLVDDHRKILSILDEMAASPSDSKLRRGRLFLALKRKLAKHAMAEEDWCTRSCATARPVGTSESISMTSTRT